MFIEEIILDGFKSYATRTVVSGFDPRFNAITGLNGSGKSNVLDAICFVLGITNLSQVRAQNLQELVYKQGQAGITKASVTILFNNQDRENSPVGYEQYEQISVARQVVIGGKNKYLINGHTAQVSQVQNLFHSVQLNVNNPHFLIMQGRITKVLNMKPQEILGMIEEAAGTRMYENKKQSALKTMEKKDKKVVEINQVLAQEITPTLEKLRKEQRAYLQWASNNTEMERLQRFCVAHEFVQATNKQNLLLQQVNETSQKQEEMKQQQTSLHQEIETIEEEMDSLQEEKEQQMGEEFASLKAKEEGMGKEMVKFATKHKHLQQSIQQQTATQHKQQEQMQEIQQTIASLSKKQQREQQKLKELQKSCALKEKAMNDCEQQIQNLNAGIAQRDGQQDASLAETLTQKQRELQENQTMIKQSKLKLNHLTQTLDRKKQQLNKTNSESQGLDSERRRKLDQLDHMRSQINQLTERFHPEEQKNLQQRSQELRRELAGCERDMDDLSSSMSSRLDFKYSDPYRDFPRGNVKGVLAKLFETKYDWAALALEITAGGRLYQIVVNNENTAKDILKHGRLTHRVTMIPLNRISRHTIDNYKFRKAEEIAKERGGKVWRALDLIEFDGELRAAMEYAFGSTLICENSDIAKSITFHRDIKVRTVTLDGDSFDPAGTLQGGSAPTNGTPVLLKLHQLLSVTRKFSEMRNEMHDICQRLDAMNQDGERFRALSNDIGLKEHELKLLDERIADSQFAQLEREVASFQEQIQQEEDTIKQCQENNPQLTKEVKALEKDIKDLKRSRESAIETLERKLKTAKQEFQKSSSQVKQAEQQLSEIDMEHENAESELDRMQSSLQKCITSVEALQKENDALTTEMSGMQKEFDEISAALAGKRQHLTRCDKKLKKLSAKQSELLDKKTSLEIEYKKMEHKTARLIKEQSEATDFVKRLEKKHAWIPGEKEFFGREHTDYDFTARDPATANQRLLEIKEMQASLSKNINKKVMGMIEKAEQEYQGLMSKRHIIEKDKEKITMVIKELDAKKNEALEKTWVKVNKDFGSIFSTLLPGTNARLDPASAGSILEGLQVRVAFGKVWKESLTELSGGQRSLLALSLILALLLFKPAPMYILDEVDAALDLSHTQNIGQMIRSHFSHSQFIVVSLKEGMFNNANVVFRTKFVDGVSTVTRTVPGGANRGSRA